MRVLVTGSNGLLGSDLIKELNKKNVDYIAATRKDFDIINYDAARDFILKNNMADNINYIVHCAAYTDVNKAQIEKDLCYKINFIGTQNLVFIAKEIKARFIYISTDYVFDGKKNSPYEIYDKPNPINFYGLTKFYGEDIIKANLKNYFIIRVSWLFGDKKNNFVNKILDMSYKKKELDVICDQVGSPTYTQDLAKILCELIFSDSKYKNKIETGIYHVTNENFCSWFDFAQEIFRLKNINIKLNPITTQEFNKKFGLDIIRPLNSRMSKKKLYLNGFKKIRTWQDALECFLNKI